ncbi:DNA glycosylase AlkZ-like family protein [Streptomyces celluloflavus]|uniref:DNA glycosylase AlkZ-like family protein n=1 Tax=Streptomyces celluloflavus TaxID=58344 RepID=UPI0036911618
MQWRYDERGADDSRPDTGLATAAEPGAAYVHRPPEELVERLAGVQAQVPSAAEPALATRWTEPAADAARAARSVVGAWGMRGTLRLLAAAVSRAAGWISPVVHGGPSGRGVGAQR